MKARRSLGCCGFAGMLLLPLALAGCSEMRVDSAYGPGIRFDGMGRTWVWASQTRMGLRHELALSSEHDALVRQVIADEMSRKGYARQEEGQTDLALEYAVTRQTVGGLRDATFAPVRTEGALVIDILDPGTGKHIWRGYAEAQLNDARDPAARKERLKLAARLILKRFPNAGK
jgi:hypothetical protein